MMDFTGENPFGTPTTRAWLTELETATNFWNLTPQLQLIAYRAAEEEVSPWGLLALLQQHQASHVDPTHVLVRRNGAKGKHLASGTGLSGYLSLTAVTGGGKNTILSAASDIIPPATQPVPDGTGQGLVKSFAKTTEITDGSEKYTATQFHQHVVVVHADEIATLNAEFARDGSKTDALMRSLWTGGTAGMLNGDKERRVILPPNFYRVHGIWCTQPENAYAIMSKKQVHGGTPQRWLWAPSEEYRDPQPVPPPPAGTTFPLPVWNTGTNPFGTSGGALPFVYRTGDEIPDPVWVTWGSTPKLQQWVTDARAAQRAAKRRDPYADPTPEQKAQWAAVAMESHTILTTIKVAVWTAWLHGRCEPTDLDFDIALAQMQVSKREAAGMWHTVAREQRGESIAVGEQRGVEMHHAQVARDDAEHAEVREVADLMWQRLATEGPKPRRALRDGLSTRRRKLASEARDLLESNSRMMTDICGRVWACTPDGMPVAPKGYTYVPA